jgi:hypothetical protein
VTQFLLFPNYTAEISLNKSNLKIVLLATPNCACAFVICSLDGLALSSGVTNRRSYVWGSCGLSGDTVLTRVRIAGNPAEIPNRSLRLVGLVLSLDLVATSCRQERPPPLEGGSRPVAVLSHFNGILKGSYWCPCVSCCSQLIFLRSPEMDTAFT